MNATSDRLSRWTSAIFACALVNLGLGLLLSVLGFGWPAVPATAPVSLAMMHLLTIGWLALLMFGALFQFVPVITSRKLPSQALPLVTLIGVECGLALMIGGFCALGRSNLGGVTAADRGSAGDRRAAGGQCHPVGTAGGEVAGAA